MRGDLPAREAELFDPNSALGRVRSKVVVSGYVNGDLLTREEAAVDPEVRRLILDDYEYDRSWEPTNE